LTKLCNFLRCITTFQMQIFACCTLMITSCSSAKQETPSSDGDAYKKIASEKFGSGVDYLFNSSKTYVVCLKKSKPTSDLPQSKIDFLVFDLGKEEIIYENKLEGGEIRWMDNEKIEVKITPGIVSGDENPNEFIRIYDVKLKTRIQ